MKAIRLRTEYLKDPVGIDVRQPRLFWNCEGGKTQTAYELRTECGGTEWESGKRSGPVMHHDLTELSLTSRDRVTWQIRLWDENDAPGEWSETAFFELGLLEENDWQASWIAGDYKAKRSEHYPVDCFRKRFAAESVKKARLYATACGMYTLQLNGQKVGGAVLTPGATDFTKRVQVQTYDVTELLRAGENDLTAELAGGWYKSYLLSDGRTARYGSETKLLLQLEITDANGTFTVIGTDSFWEWSNDGPIRFAENKSGERIDARMQPSYAGRAREVKHPVRRVASNTVPMTEHEQFSAKLMTTPSGKTVLDFGQNIAGFLSFDLTANAGDTLTLYFGELLENGEFTQRNIDPSKKHDKPFQKLEYTCEDGLNSYKTKFAIFGFQYVLVEASIPVQPELFAAVAVYSDMEDTLSFQSDHALLNQFVEATRWSTKNNSADVPTDCPTRERVGWTGDAQIFYNTAAYLFDYAAFGRKYIRDMADSQHKNGSFTQCAPRCAMHRYMDVLDSSAGWADAGVLIPYRMWKRYGDDRIIREHYASMRRYGDFLIRRCGKKALNVKRPKVPKELQKYLVMSGLSYGEWLEPKEAVDFNVKEIGTPHVEEAMAYTAFMMRHLSEIARAVGFAADAERFAAYEQGCTEAYRALVKTEAFSIDTDRQAKLVRPLYMDLLDAKTAAYAKQRLLEALEHFDWRVGTGFLSTPFLLFVLQEIGLDHAYRLLENEQIPGWLAMPKNGATTIWENWEGTQEENPVSLDHYSKGAVCEWIFSEMCGVSVAGGNRFTIAPKPGGSIRSASLRYQSVYGEVSSAWERKEGQTVYTVSIPANTTAELVLSDGKRELSAGTYEFSVIE